MQPGTSLVSQESFPGNGFTSRFIPRPNSAKQSREH
jgi:hypothetical protein